MIEVFIMSIFGVLLFALGFLFGSMDKASEEPQKPLEVHYTRHNAKKWTACKRISGDEYMRMDSETADRIIAADFADKFKDIIKEHTTVEKDPFRYEVIYRVEMWID